MGDTDGREADEVAASISCFLAAKLTQLFNLVRQARSSAYISNALLRNPYNRLQVPFRWASTPKLLPKLLPEIWTILITSKLNIFVPQDLQFHKPILKKCYW